VIGRRARLGVGCQQNASARRPCPGKCSRHGRAFAAGIDTKIGDHPFRATGNNAYLKSGGMLKSTILLANYASTRTTLYDRRSDDITLDEVERIRL
jgi:hypothetical protein